MSGQLALSRPGDGPQTLQISFSDYRRGEYRDVSYIVRYLKDRTSRSDRDIGTDRQRRSAWLARDAVVHASAAARLFAWPTATARLSR